MTAENLAIEGPGSKASVPAPVSEASAIVRAGERFATETDAPVASAERTASRPILPAPTTRTWRPPPPGRLPLDRGYRDVGKRPTRPDAP